MKILKHGKTKEVLNTEPLQLTCRRCETVIETTLGEMTLQRSDHFSDEYEIKCPVCDRMLCHQPGITELFPRPGSNGG